MRFLPQVAMILLAFPGLAAAADLPQVDSSRPLTRIAFGSCNNQDKPCPAWDAVIAAKPELLLLLGDNIYADLDRSKKVTTELIQEKYDVLAEVPAFRTIRSTIPMLAIWDDHDYGKNDADSTWELKDESQRILLDFFGVPPDSPRHSRKGVYHAEIYGPPGQRVQVIMLDGRYHLAGAVKGKYDTKRRLTPYFPTTDPGATILGEEQWAWLEEQLRQPAEIRLIGSGTQVLSEEHPFEKWMNFPNERARLFKLLRDTKANGVIILSGDRHLGELSMTTDAITYPLYDITCSGFNQATLSWRPPEPNKHRVAAVPFGNHFGVIEIDWTRETSPLISMQIRGEAGECLVRHDIRAGLLTHQEQAAAGRKFSEPEVPLPEGVISPAEAAKRVGDEVTLQFIVKAGGKSRDGKRAFLNSDADFRSEANFTVVVTGTALAEGKWKDLEPDTLVGKTIRIKGKVSTFQERPQLVVETESALEVIP